VEVLFSQQIDGVPLRSPTEIEEARIEYNTGNEYYFNYDYINAIEHYRKAVEFDIKYTDAMDNMAICYRKMNLYDDAIYWYKKSIEILPNNCDAINNLAFVYNIQGRYSESYKLYQDIIKYEPNNPEGYYGIGMIMNIIGRYNDSIPYIGYSINKYIEANSEYVYDAIYIQIKNFIAIEKFVDAKKYLDLLLKQFPNNQMYLDLLSQIR
jgi:tetratricopeptide (TPR) repeat protein